MKKGAGGKLDNGRRGKKQKIMKEKEDERNAKRGRRR